jgi:hypothetical protein
MKSGKKFFYWLGVMDASNNKPENRAAKRYWGGKTKPVWSSWAKSAYLWGYWSTKNNIKK